MAPFPCTTSRTPATAKELAATGVLRLDLSEAGAKIRTGGVNDDAEDMDLPHWAGVVPVRRTLGAPVPDPGLSGDVAEPEYLRAAVGARD